MKSRCVLQFFYFLSAIILSKAQDMVGPDLYCFTSIRGNVQTRISFLHEDTVGVRSFYLTIWSQDMRLVTCTVNLNPQITERYHSLCKTSNTRGQEVSYGFNISSILLALQKADCAHLEASSASQLTIRTRTDETERKARRKRAWIFPGTLWCGGGSMAHGYEELGMFEGTDRCCREHDHCLQIIPAFTVNYGVFNRNLFTVSHCECDQRFRQCLLDVNDSISNMVGYSFFNILRIPCFELKQQRRCTEMYWWGMCKVAKEAPYAVFKSPLPYNTSDAEQKYADTDTNKLPSNEEQHVTQSPPRRKSSKTQHHCRFRDPPRGDTFHRRRTKARGCRRRHKPHGAALSQLPPTSKAHATASSVETGLLKISKSSLQSKESEKSQHIKVGLSDYSTLRRRDSPQLSSNSDLQSSSTAPSPLTQMPEHQPHQTTAAVTKTNKSHKDVIKKNGCCGHRKRVRGDAFQSGCESCLERETKSHMKTTTDRLPIKVTTLGVKKTTNTLTSNTLITATFATPIAAKLKTAASLNKDDEPQKQVHSYLLMNNSNQGLTGSATAQSTHTERSLKQSKMLHKITDSQLLCESFKHLDYCKFKIPPLKKKYGLQNMESKTAYHCDCTSRLAVQIESLKRPSILHSLMLHFVSQHCFTLPNEEKCHGKKSCSRGFTKASDLHQVLKKIEGKDSAGVQISGTDRKRGIPVRLYKRCLRLESGADIMARFR
ncbi:group 3 secretory phospholipase A2-like [Neolamprologus brichardi]|uniref:group 3 secretory phospholipase A2-like n=1 Tax=Neolamprologus brichardi TaxID=32507 RepID=UPI0003EC5CF0|nr:group 3 secretory phospholipase A2-like [Neolamprologus brichardi]